MAQPLSMDLRSRLLAAVDSGLSCRAAARFGVAPSTAIRWQAQRRETGDFARKPRGRSDMRSRRVEERAGDILAIWEKRKDITLEELRLALIEVGLTVSVAGLHRFFIRRGDDAHKTYGPPRSQVGFEKL